MTRDCAVVILAAGQGTRMKSARPKVLHEVGRRAMLDWAIDAAEGLSARRVIVVAGPHAPAVRAHVEARLGPEAVVVQEAPLGTAHAVRAAEAALATFSGDVIVAYGDTPLISAKTIQPLLDARREGAGVAVLGFEAADPFGYGRLVRDEAGALLRIVEERDASPQERAITLCNSGVIAADARVLFSLLSMVRNENAKKEFYLTDIVGLSRSSGFSARVALAPEAEMMGVNARGELAAAEAAFQARRRAEALADGVGMIDPNTVYFSWDTEIAPDVTLEPHIVFGPGCRVASGAVIKAYSHLEGAVVGEGAHVGPFARLRPGAVLGAGSKIGNFVEIKNAVFGAKAQASHLTYVGDAEVGAGANLGCGTITCNYDGFDKYKTIIGENVFVGSDTALVAPVRVGAGAYIGSGSVITRDVPANALAVARGRQRDIEGWAETFRKRKSAERASKASGKGGQS
jgi:bifunctional UDP-N-acetylglucosamine pyrophosphorylase/glucosamine-1-phosphate N-acetyltransferase